MQPSDLTAILHQPERLEAAFQQNPRLFRALHKEALVQQPDSETLRVWQARLDYQDRKQRSLSPYPTEKAGATPLWFVLLLCFAAFSLVKLPYWFALDESWFAARFFLPAVLGGLALYFIRCEWAAPVTAGVSRYEDGNRDKNRDKKRGKRWSLIATATVAALLYAAWLPDPDAASDLNQAAVVMALLHLPLFYLTLLAICFMGADWRDPAARIRFIRYLGEVGTLTLLILIGGVGLTLISLGLFQMIGLPVSRFYNEYVVVLGLVSAPLTATYVYEEVLERKARFATLLANIFAPLFLLTILVYLLAMLVQQTSPAEDRDTLIILNGLLLIILAITLFSLAGRSPSVAAEESRRRLTDLIALALVSATLLVDLMTLSAIVLRWAEFGLTLNRVVVTGSNLLIFGHLLVIARHYPALMRAGRQRHTGDVRAEEVRLKHAVTAYLPLYSLWSLVVIVLLPQIF